MSVLLDVIVLGVIFGCGILAWHKGFFRAALGFLPTLAAWGGAKVCSPAVGRFLRGTPFFDVLSDSIKEKMGLEELIGESILRTQTEIIEAMPLPDFLREALLENNNPVIYTLLDVEQIQDYIAGYLANICMNILSVLLAFVLVYAATTLILRALKLVGKLPVLHFLNRFSGFLIGAAKGIFFLWIAGMVLTFLQCSAGWEGIFLALEQSYAAKFLYEHNLLLTLILTIFT